MKVEYPDLADYLAAVQAVTVIDSQTLQVATKLDLADSALHASAAGYGDQDVNPRGRRQRRRIGRDPLPLDPLLECSAKSRAHLVD